MLCLTADAVVRDPVGSSPHFCSLPEAAHPVYPEIDDDYALKARLGKGVSGTVYSATHRRSGRLLAIKVLNERARNFYSLKQVYREIAIHRRLSQLEDGPRFMAPLLEVRRGLGKGKKYPEAFIIMEHIAGMTLKEYLDKCQRKEISLTPEMAKTLSFNLLEALAFVHRAGILHRDIKPQNIMIEPEKLAVRVIDFGLARSAPTRSPCDNPRTKEERKSLGQRLSLEKKNRKREKRNLTPHVQTRVYRAPEVCLLEKQYSHSADIWSFGCILAEILQCQKIYNFDSKQAHDRYMFKATSCYPLSPVAALQDQEDVLDRLEDLDLIKVMLSVLGNQKPYDLSFLTSKNSVQFVVANFSGDGRIKFHKEFEGTCRDLTDVLACCLKFNPHFRLSADELLKMPAFQCFKAQHSQDQQPISLSVDSPGAFNYDEQISNDLGQGDIRRLIKEEAALIRQDI